MRCSTLLGVIASILIGFPASGFAQFDVTYQKPIESQFLSGTVCLGHDTSRGLNGVLVEERTPDGKLVISTARTDESGHFSFRPASSKGLHFLRISANGFRTTYVKVKISRWAKSRELSIPFSA